MRKRILSACAALIVMTTATLSAYAEGEKGYVNPNAGDKAFLGISYNVEYAVEPTYTVEIPAMVTLPKVGATGEDAYVDAEIKVSDITGLSNREAVEVRLHSGTINWNHQYDDGNYALCVRYDGGAYGGAQPCIDYSLSVRRKGKSYFDQIYSGGLVDLFTQDGTAVLRFSDSVVFDKPGLTNDDYFRVFAGTYVGELYFDISVVTAVIIGPGGGES
ncbi:MAG: hypothetical protein IKN17_01080 [Ruminococcus sp.]|nr:hypothetical protein [Ruminococcus sp.]